MKCWDNMGLTALITASYGGISSSRVISWITSVPRLLVSIMTVFLKLTSLPSPSVREPLSKTW